MKYAIFDLDGTIVDSMGYWRGFAKEFLKEQNLDPKGEFKDFSGVDWSGKMCVYLKENYGVNITRNDIYSWGIKYIMDKYANEVEFKPGAKELLDNLKSQGVKMCICSSTDRYMMEPVLKKYELEQYFEFTQHCRDFGKEKDEPDIFLDCMNRLGAKNPSEVIVFEDALYSAMTAKNAGFYLVGMYDKQEKKTDSLKKIANQYVTDYSQLDYTKFPK